MEGGKDAEIKSRNLEEGGTVGCPVSTCTSGVRWGAGSPGRNDFFTPRLASATASPLLQDAKKGVP